MKEDNKDSRQGYYLKCPWKKQLDKVLEVNHYRKIMHFRSTINMRKSKTRRKQTILFTFIKNAIFVTFFLP